LIEKHVLMVIGMHRSGTSSIAGLLHEAGFQLPSDNVTGRTDNPEHNESLVLTQLNERILAGLGGRWSDPPPVELAGDVAALRARWEKKSAQHFASVFPGDMPAVWKDPRLCLLLDYWGAVLAAPAVVYVWRSPADVASSLAARNGMSLALGVALWESYVRRSLQSLSGMRVLMVNYEQAMATPADEFERVLAFAHDLGWGAQRRADPSSVQELLRAEGRHQDGEVVPLLESQAELVGVLQSGDGQYDTFPALDLGSTSPWAEAVLAEHHGVIAAAERLKRRQLGFHLRRAKRYLTGNLSLP
jgi:hypothetical protein